MLRLTSPSRAEDAALRALADAAQAAPDLDNWLIVGGHMVNLHVLRTGVGMPTRDADRDTALLTRLRELGYRNERRLRQRASCRSSSTYRAGRSRRPPARSASGYGCVRWPGRLSNGRHRMDGDPEEGTRT